MSVGKCAACLPPPLLSMRPAFPADSSGCWTFCPQSPLLSKSCLLFLGPDRAQLYVSQRDQAQQCESQHGVGSGWLPEGPGEQPRPDV